MEASLCMGDWITNVAYFSVVSICAPIWEEVCAVARTKGLHAHKHEHTRTHARTHANTHIHTCSRVHNDMYTHNYLHECMLNCMHTS